MDTRLLEYFVAVAEESSFTRAAARLYVVQSTVSAGIQTLEQRMEPGSSNVPAARRADGRR
jgi:DNA-binding transcriptional LysR family regulator